MSQNFDARFELEVFYDAECPLCLREIRLLQWLDRRKRVLFTDISAADFDAAIFNKTYSQFMAEMHGRLPDGTWIIGVEVFRQLYSAVGFGWAVWPSRLPLISQSLDFAYKIFARNRLRLFGRCDARCAQGNCDATRHLAESSSKT